MAFVLALDQGTTSSRAILFDARGAVVSLAQQEFPQIFPAPGLVEHDPEAIWSSQLATAQKALRALPMAMPRTVLPLRPAPMMYATRTRSVAMAVPSSSP